VEACDGESPVAPATLPVDPVRRAKILALHAKHSRSWLSPSEQMPDLLAEMPGLLAEAEALGWDRILIEAHYAFGLAAQRSATRWELARDHYQKAIQVALRSHDYQSEAEIWGKRLWSEYHAAREPANPADVAYLIEQADAAVHHAGDNPVLLASIKYVEAHWWPVGPNLDVIVRGGPAVTPWVYVLRGHPTAKTTADLDRLVDGAADATVMPAFGVGAGNRTAEGMRYYQRGDRHRVTPGHSPGQVTVCVAEAEPTAPAMCQTIEIPRTRPEVRDGHGIYSAIPVICQR
jgi:hypothetical protein